MNTLQAVRRLPLLLWCGSPDLHRRRRPGGPHHKRLPLLCALALAFFFTGCDKEQEREELKPAQPEPVKPQPAQPQAAGGHLDRILKAKVLRIGVKGDSPPFCYLDKENRPVGFDVDLGFRLARKLGVQPVFVTVPTAERVEKLKSGEIDCIIATFTATRRRAKDVDFSIPYFQDQQKLLVKTASPVQSYRDLAGKKVAVIRNTTSLNNLKVVAPDAKPVEVETNADGLKQLEAGEVDALTGDGISLLGLRLTSVDPSQTRIAGEGFSVEPYVIGLPRNDSDFRGRVDEFLTELWNSGSWTRLFDKWLGEKSPYNLHAQFQMAVLPE